jgi:hypothetical protein
MANVLNRTTKELRRSVNTPDFDVVDWIHNPDLSVVTEQSSKHWVIDGDSVRDMTTTEKNTVDSDEAAAAAAALKAAAVAVVDGADPVLKLVLEAMAIVLQRELRAIKGNNPRPEATIDELKTEMKEWINNG